MLHTSLTMQQRSWKGLHKMTSRKVSSNFTVAGRNLQLPKGTILKDMQLQLLCCFVFRKNKVITERFWGPKYLFTVFYTLAEGMKYIWERDLSWGEKGSLMTNYIWVLLVITYSILSWHWNCSDYAAENNGQRYHQNAHGTVQSASLYTEQ